MKRIALISLISALSLPTWALADDKDSPAATTGQIATKLAPEQVEDLGDLKPAAGETSGVKTRATVSAKAQYTSNALMRGNHGSSDVLWIPTVELGINVPIARRFDLDIVGRTESIIYSGHNNRGFAGFSGAATFGYTPKTNYPRLYVGAEPYFYNSFSNFENNRSTMDALVAEAGLEHTFTINNGFTQIFYGYQYGAWFASPNIDSRDTHKATVGFSQQLKPSLFAQVYYQFQYGHYHNQSRTDLRHVGGASLIYLLSDHWSANLSAGIVDNDSTALFGSYQELNTGIGLIYSF